MFKVLIIDDEPLVRLGLKSIINWSEEGYEMIGEASNGQQGLELILQQHPDIVITDIKMPVMDGLEMMQRVFAAHFHPAFIILSSYHEFQLVKQAMKQGAEDYLIKLDLEAESLLNTLAALHPKIKQVQSGFQEPRLANGVRENLNLLREGLFKELISRPVQDQAEIQPQFAYLGIDLAETWLAGISARIHQLDWRSKYEPAEYSALEQALLNTINEIINDTFKGYTCIENQGEFFAIASSDHPLTEAAFRAKTGEMSERLVAMVKLYFNIQVVVGISNPHQGFGALHQTHLESSQALQYGFYRGTQAVWFYRNLPDRQLATVRIDTAEFKRLLPQAIELSDPQLAETVLARIIADLEQAAVLREQALEVCFQAAYLINATGLSEIALQEILPGHGNLFESIVSRNTLAEIVQWLNELGQNLHRFLAQNASHKNHRLIAKAKKYIAEHYREDISLNELAAAIQISPGYLSTVFRQDTGICFSDYLTESKINEAKRMMRESDYKIYEIAEWLGYQNAYYFSKVFKKVTGMTPTEYLGKQL